MDLNFLELSLEQQFLLHQCATAVQQMTEAQAKELLLDVIRQLMIKDNAVKYFMMKSL